MTAPAAIWHEVECGGYEADLDLWRELAARHAGPILEVGAGTGRVSIELAKAGARVVAMDVEPELVDELQRKASALGDGSLTTLCADARDYRSEHPFGLIVVAMQTIQLFGGEEGRARFFRSARSNVAPGGCVAIAVADIAQGAADGPVTFEPDVLTADGELYSSRPVAVSCGDTEVVIERERVRTTSEGDVMLTRQRESIDRVDAATIRREGLAAGLSPGRTEVIPPTESYAGAEVVLLHG